MDVLHCPVAHNPWGSTTSIPSILGVDPDGQPWAELWAGAHPSAPALVDGRPLTEIIADDPVAALGQPVLERFGAELPFLAKILAAAEPLSIQAHPGKERAAQGFADEEAAGVPIDAATRRYKDPNHKPELLVALTPFHALAGIRPLDETMAILEELDLAGLPPFDSLLRDGAAAVMAALLRDADGRAVAARVSQAAAAYAGSEVPSAATQPMEAAAWWTDRIARLHPGDPGLGVALLLNLVDLEPGEALSLRAGNMHAYLEGTGVEVMASSDNVLRGGLTPKHVDVDELLVVLEATPGPPPLVAADGSPRSCRWPTPDPDFALQRVHPGTLPHAVSEPGPRIAMVTAGQARMWTAHDELKAPQGTVVWLPDSDGPVKVQGDADVYVVTVHP